MMWGLTRWGGVYSSCRGLQNGNSRFNVHFRNIRGGFLNFQETFPDDGDVNMLEVIRTYQEVGYDGMVMPDHVPRIAGDAGGRQAFGYIRALLQMVGEQS